MKSFYLYDWHKKPVITVKPKFDSTMVLKGMIGTFMSHVDQTLNKDEFEGFKATHQLRTESELGQLTLDEILGGE